MGLPVANQNDPKYFLPPQKSRENIDNHQSSFKDVVDIIPDTWKNSEGKYKLLRDIETYK